jgi:hypothetical protein
MLTFVDFLEELTLNPAQVRRMVDRCGPKVLQMGNLQEDGSLLVPVDCILELYSLWKIVRAPTRSRAFAARISLRCWNRSTRSWSGSPRSANVTSRRLIDEFQSTPDDEKAHEQWRHIEEVIFGVDLDAAR